MSAGKIEGEERKRAKKKKTTIKEKGHMWLRELRSLSLPSAEVL